MFHPILLYSPYFKNNLTILGWFSILQLIVIASQMVLAHPWQCFSRFFFGILGFGIFGQRALPKSGGPGHLLRHCSATTPQPKGGTGSIRREVGVVQEQRGVSLAGEPLHGGHQDLHRGAGACQPCCPEPPQPRGQRDVMVGCAKLAQPCPTQDFV